MPEYIDREALVIDLDRRHDFLEEIHGGCDQYTMGFLEAVLRVGNFSPTVDAVPIVRCKGCCHSYYDLGGLTCGYGPCVDFIVPGDFYCKYGKRKRDARGVE